MSAHHLIQFLSWAVFLLLFVVVALRAIRQPWRVNIDIALLFAAPAAIIVLSCLRSIGLFAAYALVNGLAITLLLAIAYLLVRLVDDFAVVPRWLLRGSELVLTVLSAATFALTLPLPGWLNALLLLYLVGLLGYVIVAFCVAARRTTGVTRRRMLAAATGSLLLVLTFLSASLNLVAPAYQPVWQLLADACGLGAGISYFLGFAPPRSLRRAWQEPELRAFLSRAARLPRLPDTTTIRSELERGASASIGAPDARIGLWDAESQVLRFHFNDGQVYDYQPTPAEATGRAWLGQRSVMAANVRRQRLPSSAKTQGSGPLSVLAAPISSGERRLGVLVAYAPRASIFADDDLALIQLLADQATVILESRALIDEAARVRAREEATRLRDDFLSAAAHDLKTPLTTLVARAQLLERRALRDPLAPIDLPSIQVLVREGERLRRLVLELLDAARTEQGRLVGVRSDVDLTALTNAIADRLASPQHRIRVVAAEPVVGSYDALRIEQLIENLLENAIKYSPDGGTIKVCIQRRLHEAEIVVSDQGIGIPARDLPHIFDRFYRGGNVDDRSFAGMGLGLFICRGIAEQHGGRIWVQSLPGRGSTFSVALPVGLPAEVEAAYA